MQKILKILYYRNGSISFIFDKYLFTYACCLLLLLLMFVIFGAVSGIPQLLMRIIVVYIHSRIYLICTPFFVYYVSRKYFACTLICTTRLRLCIYKINSRSQKHSFSSSHTNTSCALCSDLETHHWDFDNYKSYDLG